jgi:hypothetical protein
MSQQRIDLRCSTSKRFERVSSRAYAAYRKHLSLKAFTRAGVKRAGAL